MAKDKTRDYLQKIIEASKDSAFWIKYCSVDDDFGYNLLFGDHLNTIYSHLREDKIDSAFTMIDDTNGFQIGDFLYKFKNARSKLIKNNVVINPSSIE